MTDQANSQIEFGIHGLPSKVRQIWHETQAQFEELTRHGDPVILKAAPGTGKTTSVFQVAKKNREQLTYLAARHDMYEEAEEKALEAGFSSENIAILPSPHEDCPVFKGAHDDKIKEKWEKLYNRGVNAWLLHERLEAPCQPSCPYMEGRVNDPEGYNVIIGHYTHGKDTEKIEDRLTVIDEFARSAFISTFTNRPNNEMSIGEAVNGYLADASYIPFDNYGDLIANRDQYDTSVIAGDIVTYGFDGDIQLDLIETDQNRWYHTLAPVLIFSLLVAEDLRNGWEYFDTQKFFRKMPEDNQEGYSGPPRNIVVRKQANSMTNEEIHVLEPASLSSARQVIGLDGTARKIMWDTIFEQDFDIEEYIAGDEMNEYVQNVQDMELVVAGDGTKPYSSGKYVNPDIDATVTLWTRMQEAKPILITTRKGGQVLKSEVPKMFENDIAPLDLNGEEFMSFGMVESNNDAAGTDALHIIGSTHPGDDVIEKWGAFMGERVERLNGSKGINLAYGPSPVGNDIQAHFIQDQLTQAILRGRKSHPDDDGALIVINTLAYPDWIDDHLKLNIGEDSPFRSKQRRQIVRYLLENHEVTTTDLNDEFGIHPQTSRDCLNDLEKSGRVESESRKGPYPTVHSWQD